MNEKIDSRNNMNIAMITILSFICISGICGNIFVLGIGIFKKKYQKNVTNCYIMNLAITDLLFLLFSVPFTIYLAIKNIWIFGEFICKMHIYLAHVLLQATCYTLAAMSIDRYLTIVHHLWYRRYRKPKYTIIICILIWTISCIFMFPYEYILNNDIKKNSNQSSIIFECTVNNYNTFVSSCLFTFTFYYILPLSIIGLCYSRVLCYVRRNGNKMSKYFTNRNCQLIKYKNRRVQRMLLGLTLSFALCWLPIHILELLYCSHLFSNRFYLNYVKFLTLTRFIAHGLSYFNSSLNPLLYAILNKSYFSDSH